MKLDLVYFVLLPAIANAALSQFVLALGTRSRSGAITFVVSVYLALVGLLSYEYWSHYRPDPSPALVVLATHFAIATAVWAPPALVALFASRLVHPLRKPWSLAVPVVGAVLGGSWFLVACQLVSLIMGGECI